MVGVPAAGSFLVLLFIFLGFPYDKLGDRIAERLLQSGVRIEFEKIGPALRLAGPGLLATGLRASLEGSESIQLQRAMVRLAWSSAWLRGRPAFYTEIDSASGAARGTFILGDRGGWNGELTRVDFGALPLAKGLPLGSLAGVVDATIDLEMEEQGPKGSVTFEAVDGVLDLTGVPMPIPFQTLSGDLTFGDNGYLTVKRLDLKGPVVNAGVTGNVLQAASFAAAPLRLEIAIDAESAMIAAVRSAGVRIDRNGVGKARVTGTVAAPKIR
jgi:type II secretion system protein N